MKFTREALSKPVLPIRIVHLGVGAFHRAHQVWFTQRADSKSEWGIATFTGRSAKMADDLNSQDCLYTLITRGKSEDQFEVMNQISLAQDINEPGALNKQLENSEISIVTLTITESGYTEAADGVLSKLAQAINNRRITSGAPLTIISCDNISSNGERTREILSKFPLGHDYQVFLDQQVGFVSSSVDRITPRTTQHDIDLTIDKTGWSDPIPVVTEPFASWVLAGDFRSERPQWEDAGVLFVDDIEVYENRKLWLLNAAHSYLAYRGINKGLRTVTEAIGDPEIREEVEVLWDEASECIPIDVREYRSDLLARFDNSRISHLLEQIAIDGVLKLRARAAEVAIKRLEADKDATAYSRLFAEWITFLRSHDFTDSLRGDLLEAQTTSDFLRLVNPKIVSYPNFLNQIETHLAEMERI
jgi:fructuronate reductase